VDKSTTKNLADESTTNLIATKKNLIAKIWKFAEVKLPINKIAKMEQKYSNEFVEKLILQNKNLLKQNLELKEKNKKLQKKIKIIKQINENKKIKNKRKVEKLYYIISSLTSIINCLYQWLVSNKVSIEKCRYEEISCEEFYNLIEDDEIRRKNILPEVKKIFEIYNTNKYTISIKEKHQDWIKYRYQQVKAMNGRRQQEAMKIAARYYDSYYGEAYYAINNILTDFNYITEYSI
jgi:hypothetical protein